MTWKYEKFSSICDFVRGPFGGSLKKNIFKTKGYAVYEQQHAIYDQFTDIRYFVDEDKFSEMSRFELLPGDLIMSCSGTMGRVAIVPEGIPKGIINQALLKLSPNKKIIPKFLKLWMESDSFQMQINSLSQGVAIKNMASVKILKQIMAPIPPIDEQKRIVSILDQAFANIEKIRANTEKNLKNARKLFESYLQQLLEQHDKTWTEATIGELVDKNILFKPLDGNHGEIHPKSSDYVTNGIPFIMASDIKNGNVDLKSCKFISAKQAESLRKGFSIDGDVLLSHKATVGQCAVLRTSHKYVMLTPQVTYYRVNNKEVLFNKFIYYYFKSSKFQRELNDYAGVGTTRSYIGITRQLNLSFQYPKIEQQLIIVKKIDALLTKQEKIAELYKKKINCLSELKKSLLHQAFTGQLTKKEVAA